MLRTTRSCSPADERGATAEIYSDGLGGREADSNVALFTRIPDQEHRVVACQQSPSLERANSQARSCSIGLSVLAARADLELSQEAFAVVLGVHRTYLRGLERGERNLTLRTVERLAAQLKLPPRELLG